MKKIWKSPLICLIVFGLMFTISPTASALQIIGEPIEGNSFFNKFKNTVKSDEIVLKIHNNVKFKYTGIRSVDRRMRIIDFSAKHVRVVGKSGLMNMVFDAVFRGPKTQEVVMTFTALYGGKIAEIIDLYKDIKGTFRMKSRKVPEAETMYLLAIAILGVGLYARRKSRGHSI